ncbi:50S ribosomal protein L28 [Alphaproteobacteria bacterium]|nr:50S ribosomal protein L28 [Alphaproteobacteria bacterium]
MSRVCELTGKKVLYGNNVSHANNKSSKRFLPNLQNVSFLSEALGHSVSFRVCTKSIRCVETKDGIDSFLLSACDRLLGKRALAMKKQIANKAK